jgi:hypothetical protein
MKLAYQRLLSQVVMVASTILLFLMLPVHNLITINLAVITTTTSYRLYWEIRLKELPRLKEYLTTLVKTVFWVSTFYVAYVLAGGMGLWGILILSVVIAAWKIYQGWTLFDTSTRWMADKLWNRTDDDFNLLEALTNEQGRSAEVIREVASGASRQDQATAQVASGDIGIQQRVSEDKEELQEVSRPNAQVRKPRIRTRQNKVLPELPKDLGTRNKVN